MRRKAWKDGRGDPASTDGSSITELGNGSVTSADEDPFLISSTEKQRIPSESEWLIIGDVDIADEDWGGESEIIVEAEP